MSYRIPDRPGCSYKIINVRWADNPGWKRHLELELEAASTEGWRPVLSGDGGHSFTVILERPKD
jgi:hypothetical protein